MPWIVFLSGVSADIMPFCTREYAKHLHFDGTHCPDYCTSTGSTCTWEPAVNATCTRAKSTTIFHGCSTDLGWHAEYDALPDKRVPNHDLVHPCYDSTNPDWTSESSMLSTDTNAQRQCKTMCDRVDQCVGFAYNPTTNTCHFKESVATLEDDTPTRPAGWYMLYVQTVPSAGGNNVWGGLKFLDQAGNNVVATAGAVSSSAQDGASAWSALATVDDDGTTCYMPETAQQKQDSWHLFNVPGVWGSVEVRPHIWQTPTHQQTPHLRFAPTRARNHRRPRRPRRPKIYIR